MVRGDTLQLAQEYFQMVITQIQTAEQVVWSTRVEVAETSSLKMEGT